MREVTVSTSHLGAPRGGVRLRLRPRRPARLHRPLHARLPARASAADRGWRRRSLQARRPHCRTSTPSCTITEADRPRRIIEEIRVGRRGRNRSVAVYDFTRESAGVTRVELTTFSEPATKVDRFREIGAAGWMRRKTRKSLDRLRMLFEEPRKGPPKRASIAGYERRQGGQVRRPLRHGPGPRAGALRARANMPARMPRRLLMLLCLTALAAGPSRVRELRREAGSRRAGSRGARTRAGRRGLQRLHHAPAEHEDHAGQGLLRRA